MQVKYISSGSDQAIKKSNQENHSTSLAQKDSPELLRYLMSPENRPKPKKCLNDYDTNEN